MADLLGTAELPDGFVYPSEFLRVVELGLTDLEPWWIFDGDLLRRRSTVLARRYPQRRLVPFARRQDNDDVACWDLGTGKVVVIHGMAGPGWEQRAEHLDFVAWFRSAVDDMFEHGG
ncbi:hypothetical protein ACIA8O_27020 [Kitasatospora sp. NPDC051853]|uniref:hypothetical protein n=1 Tax=Kitasatospora sp. NPDC051853 TaxID=3364058 RepID=UPI0037B30F3B